MAPGRQSILLTTRLRVCSCAGVCRIATIIMGLIVISLEAASFGANKANKETKDFARAMDIYFLIVTSLCLVLSIVFLVISICVEMKDCIKISDLIYSLTAAVALLAAAVMLFSLVAQIRGGPEAYLNEEHKANPSTTPAPDDDNGTTIADATTKTTTPGKWMLSKDEKKEADRKAVAAGFTIVNSLTYLTIAICECLCPTY